MESEPMEEVKPTATELARKYLEAVAAEKDAEDRLRQIKQEIETREAETAAARYALEAIFPDQTKRAIRVIFVDDCAVHVELYPPSTYGRVAVQVLEVAK